MPQIITPTWIDFCQVVETAHRRLIICSPFYSASGIGHMFDHFIVGTSLSFWTRLSPSDWLSGISDPLSLLAFLELLEQDNHSVELGIHQRLHAKLYIADEAIALVGSANLTEGGFDRNFELMVRFQEEEDIRMILETLRREQELNVRLLSIDRFRQWVNNNCDRIENIRRERSNDSELLAPVQEDLDSMLGYGGGRHLPLEPSRHELNAFVVWLRDHQQLVGAQVLLSRHENTDHQNLTGHFRQCFFACWRFLNEQAELRQTLSDQLQTLAPDDLFQPGNLVIQAWLDHVDNHAIDMTQDFSYPVLRGILPPSFGGTRLGGGGGISTLKRMLPLVALYLQGV